MKKKEIELSERSKTAILCVSAFVTVVSAGYFILYAGYNEGLNKGFQNGRNTTLNSIRDAVNGLEMIDGSGKSVIFKAEELK